MPPTFRKLIFTALILTALLHEPTLRLLIDILINAHIFARIAYDVLRNFINAHFPVVAAWVIATFYDALAFLTTQIERLLSVLEPLTRIVEAKMMRWATIWLSESPRWLCEVNQWTVIVAEGIGIRRVAGSWGRGCEILCRCEMKLLKEKYKVSAKCVKDRAGEKREVPNHR
jgi:hypothetical protein